MPLLWGGKQDSQEATNPRLLEISLFNDSKVDTDKCKGMTRYNIYPWQKPEWYILFLHISQKKGKKNRLKWVVLICSSNHQRGVAETSRLMQTLDTLTYFDAENKFSIYISDVSSCMMRMPTGLHAFALCTLLYAVIWDFLDICKIRALYNCYYKL